MSALYDMNDAGPQRPDGVIPDGVYCQLHMNVRRGGENIAGCSEFDLGLFKLSKASDAAYLDCEFTVISGPHKSRKLWQNLVVSGGKLGEDGVSKAWNISKATIRAMIDSALGLDPSDMSDAAKAKRALRGFSDLDGIEFFAKIGIEPGDQSPDGFQYPHKNRIAHVVVPGEPQYAALKNGQEVAPAPSSRQAAQPRQLTAQPKPAWQQDAPAKAPAQPATTTPPAWITKEKK
jgi:hypothetical protein